MPKSTLSQADLDQRLTDACREGNAEQAKLAVDAGANINSRTPQGLTPLHLAAKSGNHDLIVYLYQMAADLTAEDLKGRTPLDYMDPAKDRDFQAGEKLKNYLDSIRRYRQSRPDHVTEKRAQDGLNRYLGQDDLNRYLADACREGHSWHAKLGLDAGANINSRTPEGLTPLHLAAKSGNPDLAFYLYQRGADLTAEDSEGRTPVDYLHLAKNKDIEKFAKTSEHSSFAVNVFLRNKLEDIRRDAKNLPRNASLVDMLEAEAASRSSHTARVKKDPSDKGPPQVG